MLKVHQIHTFYGESHILHGVSLSVKEGELAVILGRNGMGKTTTMHSIIGFTPPRQGKVLFKGEEIQRTPSYHIAQKGMAIAPQGRRIFPDLTVKENLLIGARPGRANYWTLERIYEFFPRLKERQNSLGGNLSGGEQSMLSIGRALMTNPDLLLLDEPSEGLSPLMVQEVMKIVTNLKKEGLSMLMVEQNLSMALSVADNVFILNKGEVVFDGTSQQLKANQEVRSRFLGQTSQAV